MKILSKIMFFALTLSLQKSDYEEGNIRNPIMRTITEYSIM
jgi:hypothetical protein